MDGALDSLAEALKPIAVAMLKGNLSASALVRAAKLAYLQAAMDGLIGEGGRTNISRLSVITGMTRKEIASLLSRGKRTTIATAESGDRMEHRALRVLRVWTTDPRYRTASGKVIDLPMGGGGRTFSSLVRSHCGDVTAVAVLRELERLRAVARSESGQLRIRCAPIEAQLRAPARLRDFAKLIADFSGTAAQVLVEQERPLYLGFKDVEVQTRSQAERFKVAFGRRASLMLEGVEHWHSRQVSKPRASGMRSQHTGQRMGLGIYLVESPMSSERQLRHKR